MSEGYNGLKAFAFTAGITILIFIILYVAKRYNPSLFGQESFSRNYSWYFRGPSDPVEVGLDAGRQPIGEKPKMWDVRIALRYPLCSLQSSRPGKLAVGEREDEKSGASRADIDENGLRYREFFVSCIHAINFTPCAWRSDS